MSRQRGKAINPTEPTWANSCQNWGGTLQLQRTLCMSPLSRDWWWTPLGLGHHHPGLSMELCKLYCQITSWLVIHVLGISEPFIEYLKPGAYTEILELRRCQNGNIFVLLWQWHIIHRHWPLRVVCKSGRSSPCCWTWSNWKVWQQSWAAWSIQAMHSGPWEYMSIYFPIDVHVSIWAVTRALVLLLPRSIGLWVLLYYIF